MMTFAVTGAPDSHRGPDCPDVLFCRFPHRFRDICEGFGCFRRSFSPRGQGRRGPENPKGGGVHPLRPLWLRPWGTVPTYLPACPIFLTVCNLPIPGVDCFDVTGHRVKSHTTRDIIQGLIQFCDIDPVVKGQGHKKCFLRPLL